MFLVDIALFTKKKTDKPVRGYYRKGKNGQIMYVRHHRKKFLIDFQPDVREIPTVDEFKQHLKNVQQQYKLSEKGIETMVDSYERKKPINRIQQTKSSKYPYIQSGYTPDLRITGHPSTEKYRILPTEEDVKKIAKLNDDDIGKIIKPDDTLFVVHKSTPEWYENFLQVGIDTRSKPRDTTLGRLSNTQDGQLSQSVITEPGLFVSTLTQDQPRSGVIIQLKAKDIGLSLEADGLGFKNGLSGLYNANDAIIKNKIITPEEIVGVIDYDKRFIPNLINPHSQDLKKIGNTLKYTQR